MKILWKLALGVLAVAVVVRIGYETMRSVAGPPRENFTAATLEGERWSLAEHRGRKPVLLAFFGTH